MVEVYAEMSKGEPGGQATNHDKNVNNKKVNGRKRPVVDLRHLLYLQNQKEIPNQHKPHLLSPIMVGNQSGLTNLNLL